MPKKIQKKKKNKTEPRVQETRPKDFLDLIAPAAVKFNTDHYICGSMYHCTLALRSYPATTEELALLRHLGEKSGVTLSIYTRQVTAAEENGILHNAENKNRMARSSTNSMKAAVTAEGNLQDVAELIAESVEDVCGEDGFAHMGKLSNLLMKKQPDFDPRNYGFSKLSKLIKSMGRFDWKTEGADNSEYFVRDTQRADK